MRTVYISHSFLILCLSLACLGIVVLLPLSMILSLLVLMVIVMASVIYLVVSLLVIMSLIGLSRFIGLLQETLLTSNNKTTVFSCMTNCGTTRYYSTRRGVILSIQEARTSITVRGPSIISRLLGRALVHRS